MSALLQRLFTAWVYGGSLAGLLLLVLLPTLSSGWSLADTLTLAVLPAYMLHQLEEHDEDRFRRFINQTFAGGREVLTLRAVFVINIVGVWLVMAAVITLARAVSPGWGSLAASLIIVNALLHLGQGVALRRYNPGLVTAAVLFLPLGAALLMALMPVTSALQHGIGLAVAVALHAAIVLHVVRRMRST